MTILPLGNMKVCTKFDSDPFGADSSLVQTGRPTHIIIIPGAMMLAWLQTRSLY